MSISSVMGRFEGIGYTALRIVAGSLFSVHGMQKIFGWLSTKPGSRLLKMAYLRRRGARSLLRRP